jgi:hypothetical protein
VSIPLADHFRLYISLCPKIDNKVKDMSKVPYANAMRCLIYVMVYTRPNLAQLVCMVRRFI